MHEAFELEVADLGTTTARIHRAAEPRQRTLLLAPGAGAPQSHPFMVDVARRLSARGIDVVTFDFLYAARGRKMPDRTEVLEATWGAAIASVRARGGLPTERLFVGGKSMGGRIASHVVASGATVSGLVLLGYPLHPPDKPKLRRDAHLGSVPVPTLFVQGSRDPFGTEREMRALCKKLPRARLHVVPGGDHSFSVGKRAGAAAQEAVLDAAADAIAAFVTGDA